jgi:hypothetical protein
MLEGVSPVQFVNVEPGELERLAGALMSQDVNEAKAVRNCALG